MPHTYQFDLRVVYTVPDEDHQEPLFAELSELEREALLISLVGRVLAHAKTTEVQLTLLDPDNEDQITSTPAARLESTCYTLR